MGEDNPIRWHLSDDRPYTLDGRLLFNIQWLLMSLNTNFRRFAGDKEAKLPYDDQPNFPWSRGKRNNTFGDLSQVDTDMALEYLFNL